MEIQLERGKIKDSKMDFCFVGINHYDDFDWFLEFFLRRTDTKLLERLDGIYSRTAWLISLDINYKFVQHDDVGYYVQILEDDSEENLTKLEQIFSEILEDVNAKKSTISS